MKKKLNRKTVFMQQLRWMSDKDIMTISELYQLLNGGYSILKLRIPEYQREYYCDGTSYVAKLLESIVKSFPIGSILIWTKKKTKVNQ